MEPLENSHGSTARVRLREILFSALAGSVWLAVGILAQSPAEWASEPLSNQMALAAQMSVLVFLGAVAARRLLRSRGNRIPSLLRQVLLACAGFALSRVLLLLAYTTFYPEYTLISRTQPVLFVLLGVGQSGQTLSLAWGLFQDLVLPLSVVTVDWLASARARKAIRPADGTQQADRADSRSLH